MKPVTKVYFSSKAMLQSGRTPFFLKRGTLTLTSSSLVFHDELGGTVFKTPVHTILRITVHKKRGIIRVKTRGGIKTLRFGSMRPWMYFLCLIGLTCAILPGIFIYLVLVAPNVRHGRKPTKQWQATFAQHAIRTV